MNNENKMGKKEDKKNEDMNESKIAYNKKLLQLRKTFAKEVDHMSDVSANLSKQKSNLGKTDSLYTDYDDKISKSKMLSKELVKVHRRNVLMVYGSFYFLLLVCFYICFKRLGFLKLTRFFSKIFFAIIGKFSGAKEVVNSDIETGGSEEL